MVRKVTIQDVAKECGISIGTVDRVIHKRGRFAPETEKLVNDAIKKLGYVPKHSRKSPQVPVSYKIGVYYPEDNTPGSFWCDAKNGVDKVEPYLRNMGIEILRESFPSFSSESQEQAIKSLVSKDVDAIITTAFDSITDYSFSDLIPETTKYATVINRSWNNTGLFHIGPNDELIGETIAELAALYCGDDANVLVIAPSSEIEGTTRRINGFVNKVNKELRNLNIVQIRPVVAEQSENTYEILYNETLQLLRQNDNVQAVYITNGFVQPVCDAVLKSGKQIKVFGHESFSGIEAYFKNNILAATISQNAGLQWFEALLLMADCLLNENRKPEPVKVLCSVLTKESFPIIGIQ